MSKNWKIVISLAKIYNIPWENNNSIDIEQCRYKTALLKLPIKTNSHLWLIDLTKFDHNPFLEILSSDEKEKLNRIIIPVEQQRRTKSRILLRLILSNYLKIAPYEIKFIYGENGKPITESISFNISHSANYLAVLIDSYRAIGVDIESELRPSKVINSLAKRFFSQTEFRAFGDINKTAEPILFNRIWTLKEAVLKSTGTGILLIDKAPDFSVLIQKKLDSKIQFYKTKNYKGFTFYFEEFCLSAATDN